MISIKDLLPYSKPFNVLYVEDDIGIRDNYAKIFEEVFGAIEVAENGQSGLQKYQNGKFDVIITDINMPVMNGIEMIEAIFKDNPQQMIIVTSAHDDAQYLLSLIDLGIEKFLIKPVDFTKLVNVLYRSCKLLTEQKELYEYHDRVEEENLKIAALVKELQKKNEELEKSLFKQKQEENVAITLVEGIGKKKDFTPKELDFFSPSVSKMSAQDFATYYTGHIETLNDHLEGIEETLELSIHQKLSDPTPESVHELAEALNLYAHHLDSTFQFGNVAHALRHLSKVFLKLDDYAALAQKKHLLFGISDSLHQFRQKVLIEQSAEDIHFLDNSIISDCLQFEGMLCEVYGHCDTNMDDLFF